VYVEEHGKISAGDVTVQGWIAISFLHIFCCAVSCKLHEHYFYP